MTRFNAQLNGVDNVEAAAGDLFDPAGDEPFDLIVSNPPFVISPENRCSSATAGWRGDAICERIVRAAPEHLAEGGYFQMLCNWARIRGQDWRERLLGWIADSGCDVQIIHTATYPIDVYANHWLRQTDLADQDRFGEAFDRWVAYYEKLGIEAIDNGLITLRRRSGGSNWVRFEMDRRENHPNGTAILASFAAQDLLERIGGDLTSVARPEASLQAAAPDGPEAQARRLGLDGRRGPVHAGRRAGIRGAGRSGRLPLAHALPGPAATVGRPRQGGGADRARPGRAIAGLARRP